MIPSSDDDIPKVEVVRPGQIPRERIGRPVVLRLPEVELNTIAAADTVEDTLDEVLIVSRLNFLVPETVDYTLNIFGTSWTVDDGLGLTGDVVVGDLAAGIGPVAEGGNVTVTNNDTVVKQVRTDIIGRRLL